MANQVQELEKRLETLEQEVQMLMAQVQYTLLEIQEHLLNNTYPALRSTDTPDIAAPGRHSAPPATPKKAALEGVQRVKIQPDAVLADEPAPPVMNPVVSAVQPVVSAADTNVARLRDAEDWALQRIEQIGAQRTRELIEIYTRNGQFSPQISEVLYQLTGGQEFTPPQEFTDPLPEVIRRAVEQPPVVRQAAAPRPAARTERSGGNNGASRSRPLASMPARSKNTTDAQRTGSPARNMPGAAHKTGPLPEPPNLVLRLIAGVQSAGIGLARRNSRG